VAVKKTISKKQREMAKEAMALVDNWPLEEIDKLSVDEIARRFLVNRSTLSRAFRAYYYPTLRRIILRKKCHSFFILVFYKEIKSVRQGMKKLGISSQSNFTRQFKLIYRRTPGVFLREEKERYWKNQEKYS
jgi:AraC-like DNA-binding protein